MNLRIIPCQVSDEFIRGAGVIVGAAGSHHDVAIELAFSDMWAGYTKSITWIDADGLNPTLTMLTTDLLKPGTLNIYTVPIPAEPKAKPGDMTMTVKGVIVLPDGNTESSAILTVAATFRVMESKWDGDAQAGGDVNATQAEQLQQQIDTILSTISEAGESAVAAEGSAQRAEAAATGAEASELAAKASEDAAAGSASDASASKTAAQTARAGAEAAQTVAEASKNAAEASKTAAKTSETNAKVSETAAGESASTATAKANAAATSATNAATSESVATTKAQEALTAANNANTSAADALSSKNAAAGSAATASTKAGEASASATSAAASAAAATTDAQEASASAVSAISSAADALTSKNAASGSAVSASASAATATTKATEASAHKDAAKISETNAKASETAAAGSAATAKTEADRAKAEADRAAEIVGGDFPTKAEAQGYATTAKTEAITAAASDATTKANAAQTNANQYTDQQISAIPPVDISGKANKAAPAVAGNFAALSAGGDLADSGKKAADFAPALHAAQHKTGGPDAIAPVDIGAVPATRTVNGKALSANITLSSADVGADPAGTASSEASTHNSDNGAHSSLFGGKANVADLAAILAASGIPNGGDTAWYLNQTGFTLTDGAVVRVKFMVNPTSVATLNVNSTGNKRIKTVQNKEVFNYFSGVAGVWYELIYSSAKNAYLYNAARITDALATKLGLDPATATVSDGIGAAFEEVPIGDVRASIRDDFLSKVSAGKYLPCDGRVVDASNYPALAEVSTPILGKLWAQNTSYGTNNASAMIVTDTGRIVVVTDDTTYRYSDDGGNSWVTKTMPSAGYYIWKLKNNRLLTLYNVSNDNGATWTSRSRGGRILAITPSAIFCGAGTNNYIWKSTDNGSTWTSVTVGASQDWTLGCYTNSGRIIICSQQYFSVARYSDDGGTTWNALTTTVPSTAYLESWIVAPSGLIIASMSQTNAVGIWHSTNNGNTWTRVNTSVYARSMVLIGSDLYASYPSTLISRVTNYGAGTVTTSSGMLEKIESLYVTDSGDLFACKWDSNSAGARGVWKSSRAVTLPTISNFYIKVAN